MIFLVSKSWIGVLVSNRFDNQLDDTNKKPGSEVVLVSYITIMYYKLQRLMMTDNVMTIIDACMIYLL